MRAWLLRFIFGAEAMRIRSPWQFNEPRIARLPSQDLRELIEELFGHVRQLRADVQGATNAVTDIYAILQEVQYREDSKRRAWTKVAKDMAEVTPEDDPHGSEPSF